MTRSATSRTSWIVAALLICSTFSIGCNPINWFGSNASYNLIIPMGLGGTPGLLNPFGIVQAMVNAALGIGTTTDEGSASYPIPTSSSSPTTALNPAIGVIVP